MWAGTYKRGVYLRIMVVQRVEPVSITDEERLEQPEGHSAKVTDKR